MLSLILCTKWVKDFRFLVFHLVSEMKSEIKHAEMLPITIIRVFNSDKQPFAWFETKILNILAGGDREINIIDRNSCHERQEKQLRCVCVGGDRAGSAAAGQCIAPQYPTLESLVQPRTFSAISHWKQHPTAHPGAPVQPQS